MFLSLFCIVCLGLRLRWIRCLLRCRLRNPAVPLSLPQQIIGFPLIPGEGTSPSGSAQQPFTQADFTDPCDDTTDKPIAGDQYRLLRAMGVNPTSEGWADDSYDISFPSTLEDKTDASRAKTAGPYSDQVNDTSAASLPPYAYFLDRFPAGSPPAAALALPLVRLPAPPLPPTSPAPLSTIAAAGAGEVTPLPGAVLPRPPGPREPFGWAA